MNINALSLRGAALVIGLVALTILVAYKPAPTRAPAVPVHVDCTLPRDSYVTTWEAIGGTCSSAPARVVNYAASPLLGRLEDGCTGHATQNPKTCEIVFDQTCQRDSAHTHGRVAWNPGATHGTGTFSLASEDCVGVVRVTFDTP